MTVEMYWNDIPPQFPSLSTREPSHHNSLLPPSSFWAPLPSHASSPLPSAPAYPAASVCDHREDLLLLCCKEVKKFVVLELTGELKAGAEVTEKKGHTCPSEETKIQNLPDSQTEGYGFFLDYRFGEQRVLILVLILGYN